MEQTLHSSTNRNIDSSSCSGLGDLILSADTVSCFFLPLALESEFVLGGFILDTGTSPIADQDVKIRVSWPVTVLTPYNRIEGLIESLGPSGMLFSSKESPPRKESLRVVVKLPNRRTLNASARVVWGAQVRDDDGKTFFGTEILFTQISRANRQCLRGFITKHYENKLKRIAQRQPCRAKLSVARQHKPHRLLQGYEVRLPVSYIRDEKVVQALGIRFSPKGCFICSPIAPLPGTYFSLKVTNPATCKSKWLDSVVVARKLLVGNDYWGILIRFVNLSEPAKKEFLQTVQNTSAAARPVKRSKYLKIKIGQNILKRFSPKKL